MVKCKLINLLEKNKYKINNFLKTEDNCENKIIKNKIFFPKEMKLIIFDKSLTEAIKEFLFYFLANCSSEQAEYVIKNLEFNKEIFYYHQNFLFKHKLLILEGKTRILDLKNFSEREVTEQDLFDFSSRLNSRLKMDLLEKIKNSEIRRITNVTTKDNYFILEAEDYKIYSNIDKINNKRMMFNKIEIKYSKSLKKFYFIGLTDRYLSDTYNDLIDFFLNCEQIEHFNVLSSEKVSNCLREGFTFLTNNNGEKLIDFFNNKYYGLDEDVFENMNQEQIIDYLKNLELKNEEYFNKKGIEKNKNFTETKSGIKIFQEVKDGYFLCSYKNGLCLLHIQNDKILFLKKEEVNQEELQKLHYANTTFITL